MPSAAGWGTEPQAPNATASGITPPPPKVAWASAGQPTPSLASISVMSATTAPPAPPGGVFGLAAETRRGADRPRYGPPRPGSLLPFPTASTAQAGLLALAGLAAGLARCLRLRRRRARLGRLGRCRLLRRRRILRGTLAGLRRHGWSPSLWFAPWSSGRPVAAPHRAVRLRALQTHLVKGATQRPGGVAPLT